jgi:hypothetical protein
MNEHRNLLASSVLVTALLCCTIVGCVWLYTERTRFSMIQSGDRAYKYDRTTGETWLVVDSRYGIVDGPVNFVDH